LILYDTVQGGVGLSDILFSSWRQLASAALDVVTNCACVNGCPGCVGPVEEVGPLGKETAAKVLAHFVNAPEPMPASIEDVAEDAVEVEA
jgi:DEAD/DEAH box helicase domain-containing protein